MNKTKKKSTVLSPQSSVIKIHTSEFFNLIRVFVAKKNKSPSFSTKGLLKIKFEGGNTFGCYFYASFGYFPVLNLTIQVVCFDFTKIQKKS